MHKLLHIITGLLLALSIPMAQAAGAQCAVACARPCPGAAAQPTLQSTPSCHMGMQAVAGPQVVVERQASAHLCVTAVDLAGPEAQASELAIGPLLQPALLADLLWPSLPSAADVPARPPWRTKPPSAELWIDAFRSLRI